MDCGRADNFWLRCKDVHDQIESSFFFPFAEAERGDGTDAISTSGIHQKDPHVSGATKWQGGGVKETEAK